MSQPSTTLQLTQYQSPPGPLYTARDAGYAPGRIVLNVNRSPTALPRIYHVELSPGARTGSWTASDDSGTIEHVQQTRRADGVATISGMWSENGIIYQMTITCSDALSSAIP